ncbi:MFS transporter [Lichenifustis flavocetrariae]|uniref:MFS transporter n=1 Tax=Lichenifustis flavocetrariae TaxID=2949735 RepID=A0AA42CPG5_9HYPH|nr:MFS transporter [Lichenifustis flavocetrariae]MCW6510370.1 MFS transporter [Lichenifustis flavocetrariae]
MAQLLGGIGNAFSDRNFRIYSIGSITSWITYFVQNITFSWVAWDATHSTTWLALVSAATTVTTIVFLPLGGVLADRHDRLRILMGAYALDWIKSAALAALALTGHLTLPVICISAVAHGLIHSFSIPASYGLLPRFVAKEKLAAAIGVSAAYTQFAIFAGPVMAGWILVHWGAGLAFIVNVVGYAVFFGTTALLRTPPAYAQGRSARASMKTDFLEGINYIITHRGLSALLVLVLVGDAIAASINSMMPAYTNMVLELGVGTMATMFSAAGIGATVAALWLAYGGLGSATASRVLWAVLGFAVAVYVLAGATALAIALFGMLLFGFFGETRRTGTVSLMQSHVDDARRGRVMSTLFLFTQIAGAAGTLTVGMGANWTGLRIPLAISAITLTIVWLGVFRRRHEITHAFSADAPA